MMNEIPANPQPNAEDELLEDELLNEYRFDYRKAKPNRFSYANSATILANLSTAPDSPRTDRKR